MEIITSELDKGQRLDKFLVKLGLHELELNAFSRGDFSKSIKDGSVLVNGKIQKPSYKINTGDKLSVKIKKKEEKLNPNPNIKLDIIFENNDFLIINKSAGIQVHPDFNEKESTVVNGLIAHYPEIAQLEDDHVYSFQMRPGVVHRLDKETSGILIIAKNKESFLEFKKMFQEKTIKKKYLAFVYGIPEVKEGEINKPLARTTNYRKQTIAGKKTKTKIREALTIYKVIQEFEKKFSLLEVSPRTGRTHQIRVHLSSIGHPIIGDNLYSKKTYPRIENIQRHLLHASEIDFELWGEKFHFNAPLPNDFEKMMPATSLK